MEENLFKNVEAIMFEVIEAKQKVYGTPWLNSRYITLIDQMYIKARRIRELEMKGVYSVEDPCGVFKPSQNISELDAERLNEFLGIANYGLMAYVQYMTSVGQEIEVENPILGVDYNTIPLLKTVLKISRVTMNAKNSDYGDVWTVMESESITDFIIAKLERIKNLYRKKEVYTDGSDVTEGISSNIIDIINYAIFNIVKLGGV